MCIKCIVFPLPNIHILHETNIVMQHHDNDNDGVTNDTARDVREIRRIIPLEWYWRLAAGTVSLLTATSLFWLSHTYVSKDDYTSDLKLAAAATDRSGSAMALRIAELSRENERGRTETAKELGGRMGEMQDVLLRMKESLIRMEEKAHIDEQQNVRLAELEHRVGENREMLIRGQAANTNSNTNHH